LGTAYLYLAVIYYGEIADCLFNAGNSVSRGDYMNYRTVTNDKTVIQDYLFSSALALKSVAIFITLYALDGYTCSLYERNPITRLLLGNLPLFFFAEMAAFAFISLGYCWVRRTYLIAYNMPPIRWSFNVLVGFVFLTYLGDATNNALNLLALCFAS